MPLASNARQTTATNSATYLRNNRPRRRGGGATATASRSFGTGTLIRSPRRRAQWCNHLLAMLARKAVRNGHQPTARAAGKVRHGVRSTHRIGQGYADRPVGRIGLRIGGAGDQRRSQSKARGKTGTGKGQKLAANEVHGVLLMLRVFWPVEIDRRAGA